MISANNLFARVVEPDNLRLAFWKAGKGKRYASNVQGFQAALERNLFQLREELLDGSIRFGDYHEFKVFEPKERQICAPAFREQVVHHALMNVCDPYFERKQVFDSYASRRGKGVHACLDRAELFHRRNTYFLKLDVRQFFGTIDHAVLKRQLRGMFKDKSLLAVFDQIIDSYPASEERGLPIGNLTSQYFANHYLCGLDHYIKEELRIKGYVRYMDDLVLWHPDRDALREARTAIERFVTERLRQELKPPLLKATERGLPFLGYLLFPTHRRLTQASKRRFIRKARAITLGLLAGELSPEAAARRVEPLISFTDYAATKSFRKKVFLAHDPFFADRG